MSSVPDGGDIRDVLLTNALGDRYLTYALSTIMSRSLPDVRDGLKPVHRRLLYAMRQLRLDPGSGFKKSARVVGDTIGKFHPHGENAVYDALVRLAQDFAVRYPLIDGQGNFGNIDGDNPAAQRYTEARLTAVAALLLDGLDEEAVDFRATYDGEEKEPVVLPAGFPNLLANGSSGIAVGMATSIPPHNAYELCQAALHLIDHPAATTADLMRFVQGPDFPTGGILVESPAAIEEAYETGRGGFRLRARWTTEETGRGQYRIIVTEIPYQVQKSKLIERLAELIEQKKAPLLEDVRDESTDTVRIVLEPRARTVPSGVLMEGLFKLTDLEVRFPLNLNVLDGGHTPRVMSLKDALQAFLDHQVEVLVRRTQKRRGDIERRLELLAGFIIVYLNLDEVIRIIREEEEPKPALIARFDLTDTQAEAILNMRLRNLRKLEEMELRREQTALLGEKEEIDRLLGDPRRQARAVAKAIGGIAKTFGPETRLGKRRTSLGEAPVAGAEVLEALVEREPITVICSAKGWVRALKGHVTPGPDLKFKEGDGPRFALHAQTTDKLVLLSTQGRFFTLPCDRLPGGRGMGEPIRLMVDLANEAEIVALMVHQPGRKLLVAATDGKGFVVEESDVVAQTRAGKQVLNLVGDAEALVCIPAVGDTVAVIGENRKMLVFPLEEVPVMTRGQGVRLQSYKDGGLSSAKVLNLAEGLRWQSGERVRSETDLRRWQGKRGSAGAMAPTGFPKSNRFQ
ncbi:DNA topoisomerase IV subunit A [Zavarzinia sp. CC-PAN008]|uniref:DNA topoisomerase IV subunit A n=1 Tax=Zavarzinia sp. CC-PAN008 TaxID=3243332 RepID=UPI003F749D78